MHGFQIIFALVDDAGAAGQVIIVQFYLRYLEPEEKQGLLQARLLRLLYPFRDVLQECNCRGGG
jgi:hypothetical protein